MLIQLIIVRFLLWNLFHAAHVLLPVSFWSPHFLAPFPLPPFLLSFPPHFSPLQLPYGPHTSIFCPLLPPFSKHFPILPPIHFYHHHYLLFPFFSFLAPPPNTCRTIRRSTWSTYTAGLTACAPRMKAPTSSSPPLPSI